MFDIIHPILILFSIFLTCLFLFIVQIFVKTYLMRAKYKHIPGPPTSGIMEYFIGNYREIFDKIKKGGTIFDKYNEWSKYGPVFKYQYSANIIIVVNEPQAIKEILMTQNAPKSLFYSMIGNPFNIRLGGDGIFVTTNKHKWQSKRSLFNPLFHKTVLINWMKEFNYHADLFLEKLQKSAIESTAVCISDELNSLTLDIISKTALGIDTNTINHPNQSFKTSVIKSLQGIQEFVTDPLIKFNPDKRKLIGEYTTAFKCVRDFIRKLIYERYDEIKKEDFEQNDMLTTILNNNKGCKLNLEDLIDDFVNMFAAGHETTASVLSFMIYEIASNSLVYEKLNKEIEQVIGLRNEITYQDILNLEYTGLVFKETMRLWPAAGQVHRTLTREIIVNDIKIPKGATVVAPIILSGKDPKYFKDPLVFRPERFSKDEKNNITNYSYYPFSLGPRNCIGQHFAQFEAKLIIAKLMQNFKFKLDPNFVFGISHNITLRPRDGINIFVEFK